MFFEDVINLSAASSCYMERERERGGGRGGGHLSLGDKWAFDQVISGKGRVSKDITRIYTVSFQSSKRT